MAPAATAYAAPSSSAAAAVNSIPSQVPSESLSLTGGCYAVSVGTWGIGAKATDDLSSATDCATAVPVNLSTPLVVTAARELTDANHNYTWEGCGLYPASGALGPVSHNLLSAVSNLDSAAAAESTGLGSGNIVASEQWTAHAAYDMAANYTNDIKGTPGGRFIGSWLNRSIQRGIHQYDSGNYVAATRSFLSFMPLGYALVPPPFSPCIPFP